MFEQFFISFKLDSVQKAKIIHIMNEITKQTKFDEQNVITFKQRNNNDSDYVQFVHSSDPKICQSSVGQTGGKQVIKLINRNVIKI